jgi:hypothetical protein
VRDIYRARDSYRARDIFRVRNGKLADATEAADSLSPIRQFGPDE